MCEQNGTQPQYEGNFVLLMRIRVTFLAFCSFRESLQSYGQVDVNQSECELLARLIAGCTR